MSKYTTQLRYVCENLIGLKQSVAEPDVLEVIQKARPLLFNFSYPIFDIDYKETLETKILMHYWMREIGAETVGLWKLFLTRKMNEIMPYYNQLYNSNLIEFDPMQDTNLERSYNLKKKDQTNNTKNFDENTSYNRDSSGESHSGQKSNGNTKQTGDNWNKFSDTPQGGLNGVVSTDYLTEATEQIIDTTTTTENSVDTDTNYSDNIDDTTQRHNTDILQGTFTADDKYLEKLVGKSSGKSFSEMLELYRRTFINVDMLVIEELEPLFMGLW